MKLHSALLLAFAIVCGAQAHAQTPIGPFPSFLSESFDAKTPGISPGFTGFKAGIGGIDQAQILPLQGTQNLVINNRNNVLPAHSPLINLYGNGNDVQILFNVYEGNHTKFGGQFSRTNIAVGVTTATFQFFSVGVQVGSTMTVALPPTGGPGTSNYVFAGFDLTALGGFDEVRIRGNGSVQGYVGMDSMSVL